MGKRRKHPLSNNKIAKSPSSATVTIREDVEARIGLNKQICTDCNARNSENADDCRKCGCSQLRDKKTNFRD